jgi:hypothetical protein
LPGTRLRINGNALEVLSARKCDGRAAVVLLALESLLRLFFFHGLALFL